MPWMETTNKLMVHEPTARLRSKTQTNIKWIWGLLRSTTKWVGMDIPDDRPYTVLIPQNMTKLRTASLLPSRPVWIDTKATVAQYPFCEWRSGGFVENQGTGWPRWRTRQALAFPHFKVNDVSCRPLRNSGNKYFVDKKKRASEHIIKWQKRGKFVGDKPDIRCRLKNCANTTGWGKMKNQKSTMLWMTSTKPPGKRAAAGDRELDANNR